MPKVLLISDNQDFAKDLSEQISLNLNGFEVSFSMEDDVIYDMVIVDDQKALVKDIHHKQPQTPIYLLTSSQDKKSTIEVCSLINKPFMLRELLEELKSCISRFENSEVGFLSFNQYELRPGVREIMNLRNKEVIKLTEKEVAILKYLYKAQDRIVSKSELLQEVWGYSPDASTHTVETHIYRLRQKIEHDDAAYQILITEEGGYKLKV